MLCFISKTCLVGRCRTGDRPFNSLGFLSMNAQEKGGRARFFRKGEVEGRWSEQARLKLSTPSEQAVKRVKKSSSLASSEQE